MFQPTLFLLLCAPLCAMAAPAALSLQHSFDKYARLTIQNDGNASAASHDRLRMAGPSDHPDSGSRVGAL